MNPYEVPEGYTVVSRLDALLDRLETVEFDVMVNLASGLQLAVDIAAQQPAVRALVEHLRSHPGEAAHLLSRIEALATAPVDPRWRSPHEAALIGMLVAAFEVEPRLALMAAERARNAPEAPWIPRLADSIVASVPSPAGDGALELAGRYDTSQTLMMSRAMGSGPLYRVEGTSVHLPGVVRFVTESA